MDDVDVVIMVSWERKKRRQVRESSIWVILFCATGSRISRVLWTLLFCVLRTATTIRK